MAVIQCSVLKMSENSLLDEKHLHRTQLRWMATVSHSPGNKYHTREGISDTLYSAITQLNKFLTPTHALEFKIIPLFPAPHLLTLPLCSFVWTELPCSQPTTLSNPSPCSFCLPWENQQAQTQQFGGTTSSFLHFTGTFRERTGQTMPIPATYH